MPTRLLERIRRSEVLRDGGGLSDAQLLALFVKQRDGPAFTALLKRHGRMVLGVCGRVLLNPHDAEDAFQATFLILARKAAAIKAQDSVGGWLYRVAYRTALEARARIVRRRGKEQQVNAMPDPAFEPEEGRRELLALLDKELDRLPDKYRIPVVLCELEGKTRKEAARLLRVPEGTLSWRLAQAKKLLARRLARHGAVAVSALFAEGAASAQLSPVLLQATAQAVLKAGTVPARVLALSQGVLKAMLLTKLKITFCAAGLMLLAGVAATGLTYRATAEEPKQGVSGQTVLSQTIRPASDYLESLRLEMEALRRELRATRERVKSLEGEVAALKGHGHPGGSMQGGKEAATTGPRYQGTRTSSSTAPERGHQGSTTANPYRTSETVPTKRAAQTQSYPVPERRSTSSDPLGEAEAALKKLREDPSNREAAEALERALKRLKEWESRSPSRRQE